MNAPRLRRGLFGYSGRSVRLALAVREREVSEASERATAASQRAEGAEARASGAEDRCAALDTELSSVRSQLEAASGSATEARDALARREELLDELRFELGASRRLFLRQAAHSRDLETTLEDLAAQLWQARVDLEKVRHATPADGSGPLVILPDLELQGTNGHAQPAPEPV